jgi:GH15 family glucan-1,4-alpha-glucosidase
MDLWGYYDSSEKFFEWVDMAISKQKDKIRDIVDMAERKEVLLNSDYLPTRYRMDGEEEKDEWPNFQLDGYGTWLWVISEHMKITGRTELIEKYKDSIYGTVDYLTSLWRMPNYDCWEENGDKIHPSTLSCIYGGLNSVAEYIDDIKIKKVAGEIKEFVIKNCVMDGRLIKYLGSESIDASLLWASIPFRLINPDDTIMKNTVYEIEKRLVHDYGVHRYPEDTYYGGGEWLLLSGFLGWYYAEIGDYEKATKFLEWIEKQADNNGDMVEQVLYHVNNEDYIEKWKNLWGEPAKPLLWSHAMYLILDNKLVQA